MRWGKPIKNKKHRNPKYFLHENLDLEEALPPGDGGEELRDAERVAQIVQLAVRLGVSDGKTVVGWIESPLSPEQIEQRWSEGRRGTWET